MRQPLKWTALRAAVGVGAVVVLCVGLALYVEGARPSGVPGDGVMRRSVPSKERATLVALRPPIQHRGLPRSLDDFPRTSEFRSGLEWLRQSGNQPPQDTEGLLDYRLQFQNRLETCYGPLPSTGNIQYEFLFEQFDLDGGAANIGPPDEVTVRRASGLSDSQQARLEECGKVAYSLPLVLESPPTGPEFHMFLWINFPLTEDSYPYKLLRTGKNK